MIIWHLIIENLFFNVKKYSIIAILFFLIDRFIKYIAPSINIEGGFVKIGFYQNYSGAFSLPISGWLYNVAGAILFAVFVYLFFKEIKISLLASSPFYKGGGRVGDLKLVSYGFIILGGLSNLFDRFYYGYTIDYVNVLDFSFFNLADGMLIMGIATLLHWCIVKNKKQYNNVTM